VKTAFCLALILVASTEIAEAQGSFASDPKAAAALEAAQKWYDGLPPTEKQAVDKRYADYAAFMIESNEAMNEKFKGIDNNERMLYIQRFNDEMRKRRGL
jgi:hypothetical protein